MDIRKVKKLIELLEESNIDEIEIQEGEESVRISRNGSRVQYAPAGYAPPPPTYRGDEFAYYNDWDPKFGIQRPNHALANAIIDG